MAKVSVIMSAFNQEAYIRDAVKSILEQSFLDFELIVIDDGSTDQTLKVLDEFSDKRLKIFANEKNQGLIFSLNRGVKLSEGSKYIARMDSDDISRPDRFKKQVEFLDEFDEVGVLGTAMRYFGDLNTSRKYLENDVDIKSLFLFTNPISHPTVFFRSNLGDAINYDNAFPGYEDYALWISLINKTKFHNLPEELLLYRRHNSNVTNSKDIMKEDEIYKRLLVKYANEMSFSFTKDELDVFSTISSKTRFSLNVYNSVSAFTLFESTFISKLPDVLKNNKYFRNALTTRILLYFIGTKKYPQALRHTLRNAFNLMDLYDVYKLNKSPV
ncbi:MAG: glycosyltransferase [Flavobacterium sp.]|nr:MAG: glycosyltransferase [Flavobacterium sp.]